MGTYPVVVLHGLGDEGVDEQGKLLLCWGHAGWCFMIVFENWIEVRDSSRCACWRDEAEGVLACLAFSGFMDSLAIRKLTIRWLAIGIEGLEGSVPVD